MFAIRDDREYVNQEDLTKAARKVGEAKKHESEFLLFTKCLCYPSDREAHRSENGVLDVTFSMVYISLLSCFCIYAHLIFCNVFFSDTSCYLAAIKPLG